MPKAQRGLRDVLFETGIREHTGIRNRDEKQPFFNWQPQATDAREVGFVESPNAFICEPNIPSNEARHREQARWPKRSPFLHKRDALVEARHERN